MPFIKLRTTNLAFATKKNIKVLKSEVKFLLFAKFL